MVDLAAQGPSGQVPSAKSISIGSFSKVFAANGGFAATSSAAIRAFCGPLRRRERFRMLSHPSVRRSLKAVEIVRSPEGDLLRDKVPTGSRSARNVLQYRESSPASRDRLCRHCWDESVGRITAALCFDHGVFANLIEYPAVSVGACRLRMQVMATHTCEQAQRAAEVIGWASEFAKQLLGRATAAASSARASAGA